jgi:hypothetical protein
MAVDYNSTNANSSPPKQSLEGIFCGRRRGAHRTLAERIKNPYITGMPLHSSELLSHCKGKKFVP